MKFRCGERVIINCPSEPDFHNKIGIITAPCEEDYDILEEFIDEDGTIFYSVLITTAKEKLELSFEESELRRYNSEEWSSESL